MKIKYIANIRLPTEKAHGVQIMKMCEAFALAGADVELIVPRRRSIIHEDPFTYYGVRKNFSITKLFTVDLIGVIPRLGFWVESIFFSLSLILHLRAQKSAIFYSRN